MPEISRFESIVITMYFNEHNPPHFHAEYNGTEALFDLNEGAFTKGSLPSKQARLVLAWYELHKDELLEIWNSKKYIKIKPLS
ncbi:MAG: DUF4160 domain-containing protein [Clostridiales bacterium]|jgi:hypothetical protein|nr:DUF4160 domain-containing protein [Clostridiales bacterium]